MKRRTEPPHPAAEAASPSAGAGVQAENAAVIGADCADILDAVPFYVLLVDADHYILHANKAVRSQLGVNPQQIVGVYCPKAIHGLDRPFHGCPLEEAAATNKAVEWEVYDANTGRWVRSAAYPTGRYTGQGKQIFFHLVTDITEAKRAEEQLQASRERLRTISSHLETVREEERKRIARDLHDETSQVVASLSAHLEAAMGLLPPAYDKVKPVIQKAQQLSISILDELHKVIYELHPFLLEEHGLAAAVESLIEHSVRPTGLKVTWKTSGTVKRLGLQTEITLFRVIQEALSNIVRHAGATTAAAAIRFQKGNIRVTISDDGRGFDVERALDGRNRQHGFGITGMRERIELINGTLSIDSSPGAGTRIDIQVPIGPGPRSTRHAVASQRRAG